MPESKKPNTVLVHVFDHHSAESGGQIKHDITTEYHLDLKTRMVIQRVYHSCKNALNPRENVHQREDPPKILRPDEVPGNVRIHIQRLFNNAR